MTVISVNNTDKMSTRVALVHDNKTIIDITHSNSDCSNYLLAA